MRFNSYIFKKKILSIFKIFVVILPFLFITIFIFLSFLFNKNKLQVLNYENYLAPKLVQKIKKDFTYVEFGDLPDLEVQINQKNIAYAIGSDYFNARLAKNNKLAKINFHKIFNIDYNNATELSKKLQKIYTADTWELLKEFNHDDFKLYEYMIPYFIQNKILSLNFKKLHISKTEALKIQKELSGHSYKEIFIKLKKMFNNKINFIINDYYRDNLMIGSENDDGSIFGANPTLNNYKNQISHFNNLTKMFNNHYFESDGVKVLENLINPNLKWNLALMYNGDALDGYYPQDNFANLSDDKDHNIIVIKPKNPTFLLDGVIIPKYIFKNKKLLNSVYKSIKNNIYQGFNLQKSKLIKSSAIFTNFNFVNYSMPFQHIDKYIQNTYFGNDLEAKFIYQISDVAKKNHIIQNINDLTFRSILLEEYNKIKL